MNRETILRLASEAGFLVTCDDKVETENSFGMCDREITKLIELVEAHEREACETYICTQCGSTVIVRK